MPKGYFTELTEDQESFIKANYLTMPVKFMARELGTSYGVINRRLKKFGLEIPKEVIEARKQNNRFNKGHVPYSKGKKQADWMSAEAIERTKNTRFKKGRHPHNTKYDGHERITVDGYIEIRLSIGNYRLKHIVEWEKINGKLPESYCLKCQTDNKLNTDPGNWKLISRAENMLENSKYNYPKEIIPSMVLVNKIKNKLNNLEDGPK